MSPVQTPDTIQLADAPAIDGFVARHARDDDWDAIAEVVNAARRGDGVDEVRSGASLRAEYAHLDEVSVERDVIVAHVNDRMAGYAMGVLLERDGCLVGEMWGAVRPEDRHQGIGTALWRWNRARLSAAAAADPRPGPRELRSYALDIEAADLALIADQGYVPIRYGFEMRRFLTGPLPQHPLPVGLELRPVVPGDHRAIWEADAEAFRDHWGHREQTEGDFVARFAAPETNTALWSVAWDGDQVAGSVMTAVFTEENEALGVRRGWLEHVSVRRQWRGRGLAKALCADAFRVLREHGMDEAWLGVDGSNPTGALQLYEALGFHVVRRWQAFGRPMDRPAPAGWTSGSDAADGS
ncbi:MAG TPA: GNAT family N-acetyltransferase [Candidatus Limnocylindrales bacterium]|jgi:mycothiol synthase|nr:GNAT family N-acetyltransferase [Candidatus Limnocylindrales bacterium]